MGVFWTSGAVSKSFVSAIFINTPEPTHKNIMFNINLSTGLVNRIYFLKYRSTNLDSWTPDQLKMMSFGGNNRAQAFFKQHGWTDGGKIEAKYTSRAANLYRQLLTKEVAKSAADEVGLPSSPVVVQSVQSANGFPGTKIDEAPAQTSSIKDEVPEASSLPKASQSVITTTVKRPLAVKKTGKTGGLGARKLTTKVR